MRTKNLNKYLCKRVFGLLQSNPFENAMKEGKDAFSTVLINEGASLQVIKRKEKYGISEFEVENTGSV